MTRLALALTLAALIFFPAVVASQPGLTPNILAVPTQAAPTVTPPPPLPSCAVADQTTPMAGYDDWGLTLLDTRFALPRGYVPPDLVSTASAGLGSASQVRAFVLPDLTAMAHAAAGAGARLGIESTYRSYGAQAVIFSRWSDALGRPALLGSARPGHSEHQLGTAIDFRAAGGDKPWKYYNWARDTDAGRWLAAHAWEYGFVMSYPAGKTKRTCYGFEPWHYRYVGREAAAEIHASGLTLREWLWRQHPAA